MWLKFNNLGVLMGQISHGTVARVGQVADFNIFAHFEGIDTSQYTAVLSLKSPSGAIISNRGIIGTRMTQYFTTMQGENQNVFTNATNYIGYQFDFDSPIFSSSGLWQATIELLRTNVVRVTGKFSISVEETTYDPTLPVDITASEYEAILNNFNNYLDKPNDFYFRALKEKYYEVVDNVIVSHATDGVPSIDEVKKILGTSTTDYKYAYLVADNSLYKTQYVAAVSGGLGEHFEYARIGVDLGNVFVARYTDSTHYTTYSEIKEIIDEGKKLVVLLYEWSPVSKCYALFSGFGTNEFYFDYYSTSFSVTRFTVKASGWTYSNVDTLLKASNKTTIVNAQSTNTQIPTAKAVYDAIINAISGLPSNYTIANNSKINGTLDPETGNYISVLSVTILLSDGTETVLSHINLKVGDNIWNKTASQADYWVSSVGTYGATLDRMESQIQAGNGISVSGNEVSVNNGAGLDFDANDKLVVEGIGTASTGQMPVKAAGGGLNWIDVPSGLAFITQGTTAGNQVDIALAAGKLPIYYISASGKLYVYGQTYGVGANRHHVFTRGGSDGVYKIETNDGTGFGLETKISGGNYISYSEEQTLTTEQVTTAQKNLGFQIVDELPEELEDGITYFVRENPQ